MKILFWFVGAEGLSSNDVEEFSSFSKGEAILSFIYLFIYLFICLFVCLFIYLFIYIFIYLFTYLYQYLYRLKYASINVQYQIP